MRCLGISGAVGADCEIAWAIQEGDSDMPKNIAFNPKVGDCTYWPGGVFAIGGSTVVIDTHPGGVN